MSEVLATAKGNNGSIDVLHDRIVIHRKGFRAWSLSLRGDKEILLRSVSAVQYKRPGILSFGYLRLAFAGGQETKSGHDVEHDENAITFTQRQAEAFDDVKTAIEDLLHQAPASKKRGRPDAGNALSNLERLAQLHEQGALTDQEFTAAKRKLLGL